MLFLTYIIVFFVKALHYNFSFGNSLSKLLQNLMKVIELSLTKIITSFTKVLTKLTIENLINLLFSKFELSLSFDNYYRADFNN